MRPEPLTKFFEDNNYRLVYPAVEKMEPGEIRRWTYKKGLSPDVAAFKDQCFQNLQPRPNKISFGNRMVNRSGGIELLVGLNQALIPYEAELNAQFERGDEIEIDGGYMPTSVVSEIDLMKCIEGLSNVCKNRIEEEDNVIISQVVQSQKFTFKFKGLKKGKIGIVLEKLLKAGFECSKKNEETIELSTPTPMAIAFSGYRYKKKKGELSTLYRFGDLLRHLPMPAKSPEPELKLIELDDITKRIAGLSVV